MSDAFRKQGRDAPEVPARVDIWSLPPWVFARPHWFSQEPPKKGGAEPDIKRDKGDGDDKDKEARPDDDAGKETKSGDEKSKETKIDQDGREYRICPVCGANP